MRGQVIDGLYKGCVVETLPQENCFTIQGANGSLTVSPTTTVSVTDISHNYPGFGAKTYMVRWKQDAVSVLQVFPEQIGSELPQEPTVPVRTGKRRKKKSILPIIAVLLVLAGGLAAAWALGVFHTHDWKPADCLNPQTCRNCGATQGKVGKHTPGNWEVTAKSSYGTWGTEAILCNVCDEVLQERTFLTDASTNGVFTCTADEFRMRLDLWLKEAGVDGSTEIMEQDGAVLKLRVRDSRGNIQSVFGFTDADFVALSSRVTGKLNASTVFFSFQKGQIAAETELMPVFLCCCIDDLTIAEARTMAADIRRNGSYQHADMKILFKKFGDLDYLILGYEGMPDALTSLPAMPGSTSTGGNTSGSKEPSFPAATSGGIFFDSAGNRRTAEGFVTAFREGAAQLYDSTYTGDYSCSRLTGWQSYSFALSTDDPDIYSVMCFLVDGDMISHTGQFENVSLTGSLETEEASDNFAFQSAALVYLVYPEVGGMKEAAEFLDYLIGEMDSDNAVLKTVGNVEFFMSLNDDGLMTMFVKPV